MTVRELAWCLYTYLTCVMAGNLIPGAQLSVRTVCTDGHEHTWRSSNNLRNENKSAACINIELSASMIITGQLFQPIKVEFHGCAHPCTDFMCLEVYPFLTKCMPPAT